jgi:uroporphyrin-3 C-methyltransferase
MFERVVGSVVEVRKAPAQDLIDPASRDAAVTAVRLELAVARLALARRDADDFHAALARMDRWLPRLYPLETLGNQRRLLASLRQAPLRYDLPALGGTLTELRRLRQQQPESSGASSANAQASGDTTLPASPASTPADRQPP